MSKRKSVSGSVTAVAGDDQYEPDHNHHDNNNDNNDNNNRRVTRAMAKRQKSNTNNAEQDNDNTNNNINDNNKDKMKKKSNSQVKLVDDDIENQPQQPAPKPPRGRKQQQQQQDDKQDENKADHNDENDDKQTTTTTTTTTTSATTPSQQSTTTKKQTMSLTIHKGDRTSPIHLTEIDVNTPVDEIKKLAFANITPHYKDCLLYCPRSRYGPNLRVDTPTLAAIHDATPNPTLTAYIPDRHEISVKTSMGKVLHFHVEMSDRVECIKAQIHGSEGIPPEQQGLIFCGQYLQDGRVLADYNIQYGDELHLVLRLRGC